MTIPAGTRLGNYEIAAPLGTGGMGEVYRALDLRLSREVAVKVLPASLGADREFLARFEAEARTLAALSHPNITIVHDVGSEEGVAYLAMELVHGVTLRDLLQSGAPPRKKALAIAAQVAEGLAAAHARGIVHRDLKPENVMVTKDGLAKLLDFGLARRSRRESNENDPTVALSGYGPADTAPGTILGTVGYMSPEQASGKAADFRSDQFSFGAILYELLTGRRAFKRATAAESLAAIIREEPEPVEKVDRTTPAPVSWIVERCLAKEPDERYAATRDLARDLRRAESVSSLVGAPAAGDTAIPP